MKPSSTCIECDKPAAWIRHTQFAGSHELCDAHARAEDDFLVEDSTKDWEYVGADAVLLAQHLFRLNHARCFWHMPPDFVVTTESVPAIAKGLRAYGGHQGFLLAAALLHKLDGTALANLIDSVSVDERRSILAAADRNPDTGLISVDFKVPAETVTGPDVGAEVVDGGEVA